METRTLKNNADNTTSLRKYDFDGFDATFVNDFDQYRQECYDEILSMPKEKNINLWAWKNDKANAEFAILCAENNLDNVKIKVSDMKSESDTLSSSNIKCSFIKDVKAYTGHAGWYANNPFNKMPKGERKYYPEVIYSDGPVTINANKFQLVWVEINTSKTASAGVYRGSIEICADNIQKSVTLDCSVEILDIEMPDCENYKFDVEYWSHPYNVAYYYGVQPFSQEHLNILKQHMTLYKSLGGHAVTASIVEDAWGGQTYAKNSKIHYPSMIKWIKTADGDWKFDYTHFDKWITLNKEIGIADKIICYSLMPWKNVVRYYDESKNKLKKIKVNTANKTKYEQVWKPFLQDFIRHLDEKDWFDSAYIGFDERHNMQTALDLINDVKNKDGKTLKISAAFNDFKHNSAIFDRLNYASVGLDQIRNNLKDFKEQVSLRRNNEQETTMYTATEHVPNSFTKSIPVESYWTILFACSLNATGFLRWAYDAWVEEPLKESTHWSFPAGDCFLVYPTNKDEQPQSKLSLRLAKLDEGVRDVNKLYLMRESCLQLAEDIQQLFDSIKGGEENNYEFYTMSKTNIWGRKAKWLTENGKENMLKDMQDVKTKLYLISKSYCDIKNK